MQSANAKPRLDEKFVANMVESGLRIGLLFILLIWSFNIVTPYYTAGAVGWHSRHGLHAYEPQLQELGAGLLSAIGSRAY